MPAKFEVAKFNGLGDAFTRTNSICPLGAKVTRNVAQHTLHHVIYAPTKLEVTTSKGIYEKIHYLSCELDFGSRSHEILPSALYIM